LYNRRIRAAKILHNNKEFEMASRNGKKIWQLAREVTGTQKKSNTGIGEIENFTDDTQKATAFNEFYVNIAGKWSTDLPPARGDYKKYLPDLPDNFKCMKFKDVTFEDVEQILYVMIKNKTSFSHDNISNKQLRFISKEISFPLSHLFNISLRTNYISESWKTAKIVPLLKSGDSRLTTNYRPISLSPTLSTIMT
jgi:hypothetical protein